MASIIKDILIDRAFAFSVPVTAADLEKLYETARTYAWARAEGCNIYYSHAYDNLSAFDEFEPDASEVREMLGEGELGDWRKVMQAAAMLATDRAFTAQLEDDLGRLGAALKEAEAQGFEVRGIHASCIHGWAPHASEASWDTGTLHRWARLEGGQDANLLRVRLYGGHDVWLDLAPVG